MPLKKRMKVKCVRLRMAWEFVRLEGDLLLHHLLSLRGARRWQLADCLGACVSGRA